ncbi:hypothetical protein YDYSG_34870 [Paenibacillus tyrfis]|uniref:ABC transporter permease n=1 Tax=Paenibacillus TaxID=44249 RepID=UPI002490FF3A|nr:ABC transporter permease [Paenibacillus tyrfis]GLI07457.1 hypothetical protein YDYSG_34870 [Paenibacillus tyrfis]GMX62502.1 hypothetical protein Elgi_23070 [Paenibacillus elgii]
MFGLWLSEMERIWKRKQMLVLGGIYWLLWIFNTSMLYSSGWGDYRFGGRELLHDLNTPWFAMEGISLLLVLAIFPILFVDHLGGEIFSGAYRLYMLRAYSRFQLWLAKLLALASTVLIFVGVTCFISIICARLFFPHSETFIKYGATEPVGSAEALWYTVAFYLLFALVCLAKLLMCSMVCQFVPRPLVAFIVLFVGSIAMIYAVNELSIYFDPFYPIVRALSPDGSPKFWFYLLGSMAAFAAVSLLRWQRKIV